MRATVCAIVLAIVATFLWDGSSFLSRSVKVTESLNDTYDYIVVGSGTAGSVLAARLSEKRDVNVLLLEAGGHYDEHIASQIPGLFWMLQHSDFDWEYYTEPQQRSGLGLNNRQAYWPRGKILGGSNMLNMFQYTRGSRYDFDHWEELGCKGWNYENVLPYFIKSEGSSIPGSKDSEFHGKDGPMGVIEAPMTDLDRLYLKAGEEMGYSIVDYNGKDQEGFSPYQVNIANSMRVSTADTYLKRASQRTNIHIALRSFVTKIVIENKRTTGVYVIRNNKKYFIKAKYDVILSTGAINTPQLLMLSGIGPQDHLEELGIPIIADLPVGNNLKDHPRLFVSATIEKPLSAVPISSLTTWDKLQFKLIGAGPLAQPVTGVTSFLYTDTNDKNKTGTDTQFNFFSLIGMGNLENVKDELYEELGRHGKTYGFTTTLIMNHLKSSGTVRLRSTDPFDYPVLDPNYLSVPSDVEDFIKAVRLWESFIDTPTMKSIGVSIDHMKVSVCKDFEFRSDAYWECYVRHFAVTTYHQLGTCKMGALEDRSAVVDPSLRVKGVTGLRVVDASVFPTETSGNINAPVVMVAEKAADIILHDHKNSHARY